MAPVKARSSAKSRRKALEAVRLALQKKALKPVVLEMSSLVAYTDYFIICSGSSTQQVRAIVDNIEEGLARKKAKPMGIEGRSFGHWVLMDYGDVVVHVFEDGTREFYGLEKLWLDAPRLEADEDSADLGGQDKRKVSG